MAYLGRQPNTGVRNRYVYTASGGQTLFSGTDSNGKTLKYDDGAYVDVYLNGVNLVPTTDFTATTKTSITLTSGAAASDIVEIVAYDIASIADTVSKANGGTFDGAITVNGNFSADGGTIKLDGNYPTGTDNVALGNTALDDGSLSGGYNTAVGASSLSANTTGFNNNGFGSSSLLSNTTGNYNAAFGNSSLRVNTTGASNTAFGVASLQNNTTASNNTAVGYQAGYSNQTGQENVFIGRVAGYSTTNSYNVAVGDAALYSNTSGGTNTALGKSALQSNTTASNNTAVGYQAGYSNTTGSDSTFLGHQAGRNANTGTRNTAVGYQSGYSVTGSNNTSVGTTNMGSEGAGMSGSYNVAVGTLALAYNTSASNNVAVGYGSLLANTTGTANTATGTGVYGTSAASLQSNTTGSYNTAFGNGALGSNTTASNSVAVGYQAGYSGTTAYNNVAVGYKAGYALTSGYQNVLVGTAAGWAVTTSGQNTLIGNDTSSQLRANSFYNTCVGNNSGNGLIDNAEHNIFIGHSSATNGSDGDRQICIGTDVTSIGNDNITFGRNTVGRVYNNYSSNATWTRTSDVRLKKDIQDNTDLGLAFVNDLRTVTYKWKAPSEQPEEFVSYDPNITEAVHSNKMYGFIAQEVKAVMDNHNITDFNGWTQTEGHGDVQGISYEMFVMPLVKAVQELSAKNDALEARLAALENA